MVGALSFRIKQNRRGSPSGINFYQVAHVGRRRLAVLPLANALLQHRTSYVTWAVTVVSEIYTSALGLLFVGGGGIRRKRASAAAMGTSSPPIIK